VTTSSDHDRRIGDLVLGALAGKVAAPSEVARSERALVHLDPGTLYFPVLRESVEIGGVFFGSGHYIVDAIVETREGAIGQSQEAAWDGSLLLLSEPGEWSPPTVVPAGEKDVHSQCLESNEDAFDRAWQILTRFADRNIPQFPCLLVHRRSGWQATILDKKSGKTSVVACGDRVVVADAKTSLVIKGNDLVKTEGRHKVLIVGHRGAAIRID
jgi:hypothetical protein